MRRAPADVPVYYDNLLSKLQSSLIRDYLNESGREREYQCIKQLEEKLVIIFDALKSGSGDLQKPSVPPWLQRLDDVATDLETIVLDIDLFIQQTADPQRQIASEDQNDPSSEIDDGGRLETTSKEENKPASDEDAQPYDDAKGGKSKQDSDKEYPAKIDPAPNQQEEDMRSKIFGCLRDLNSIYKEGITLGVIKLDDGETSHDNQIAHMDSHDNCFPHSSEESAASIDPESLEMSNRDFNIIPIPKSTIQSQQRIENERLVHWLPKKIMNIFCIMWLYRLLNVFFELLQIIIIEVNDKRKISDSLCHQLILITSAICLLISIGEFYVEAKRSKVVWQIRGNCCWLYNPGNNGKLFGSYSLYLGVICSAIQFCVNLLVLLLKEEFMKADVMGFVFAMASLIAPMFHPRELQWND